jgi:hypothetical protein
MFIIPAARVTVSGTINGTVYSIGVDQELLIHYPGGNIGLGVGPGLGGSEVPAAKLHIQDATGLPQLRLSYDVDTYADFSVSSAGLVTCAAPGGLLLNTLPVAIGSTLVTDTLMYISGQLPVASSSATGLRSAAVAGPSIATAIGISSQIEVDATATSLTEVRHIYVGESSSGFAAPVTNQYGIYLSSLMLSAANNYGILGKVNLGTNNNWNIYISGTAPSYFSGSVGIGINTLAAKLHLKSTTSPQFRIEYGAAAYADLAVASSGELSLTTSTINLVGKVGINTTNAASMLHVSGSLTGATTSYGFYVRPVIAADVTTAFVHSVYVSLADSTALTNLHHIHVRQGALGTGASIATQYGININNSLTGATTNYGISCALPVGPNTNWNIYSSGAAPNYFSGSVGIGSNTISAKLHVTATTEQLRLGYDATNYASFTVSSAGMLVVSTNANKLCWGNATRTPASASAAGTIGELCWDANYIYICTAANTWKRAAIATW